MAKAVLFLLLLFTPPPTPTVRDLGNDFANKYNVWANYKRTEPDGVVNVKEVQAWRDAVKAWDKLKKDVQY